MIYEQLRNYCNCIESEVTDADIDELIGLISMFTCWTQKPCENFLMSERKQVRELPDCLCDCDVYEFIPFYTPFDAESFKFTLVTQTGIEETSTSILDFAYSETDESFKMKLPIPSCKCAPDCGCETKYKLIAEYNAGYEMLPDCLIPLFCEGLQYIKERRECDCCASCQTCEHDYEADRVEVLVADAAKLTDQLKVFFMNTLTMQYKRQLSLISLCGRQDYIIHDRIWGAVV